jgi:hypothetical protein
MLSYGISDIQNKPSLMKIMDVAEIVDRRAHTTLGYFISSKYDRFIIPIIEQINKDEKISKLKLLKKHQDLEFAELGVEDGL